MRKSALALVLALLSTAAYAATITIGTVDTQASLSDDDQHKSGSPKTPDVRISTGATGSPANPAWDWNDEDRVRTRFDPKAIRERAAAHAANVGTRPSVHSQTAPTDGFR